MGSSLVCRSARVFALLATCWFVSRAAAQSADSAELQPQLDAIRRELDATNQRLAQQAESVAKLRAALDAERASKSAALFRVGGLAVRMSGFVQADVVAYHDASQDELNPSTGEPLNETSFTLRRARLRLDADYKFVGAILEFDGNTIHGATARVTNAEVWAAWRRRDSAVPYVLGAIGLMRIPFGYEVQQTDYQRLFIDRSNVIRALFPGEFDLGLRLAGGWRFLRYQVAAMNGNPAGDRQFAARDPNKSKDLLGRLGIELAIGERVTLQGGLSALYGHGFSPGIPASKDSVIWRDANLDGQVDPTELEGVLGMPAVPSQNFSRYAVGGDLRIAIAVPRLGELVVYGELVSATNLDRAVVPADPIGAGRTLRELGGYVGFTQELSRWAMFGVRYDRYDPDADATDRIGARIVPRNAAFATVAIAAAAMFPPWARLVVEYDRNWNALGRSASGAPATLGGHVLTARAQVVF